MSAPPTGTLADPAGQRWAPSWWAMLLIGLALRIATIAVGGLTGNAGSRGDLPRITSTVWAPRAASRGDGAP
ncbi:MAG: hypothetical protein E6J01_17700 [Chloroflexi bacterium]|nr:MAG: hypothetical protein E6J01_17700 [Chloroflexota bacterium]